MIRLRQFALGLLCLLSVFSARAGIFDIQLDFGSLTAFTDDEILLFDDAAVFWESKLIGVAADRDVTLSIDTSAVEGDGIGGVLASAGGGTSQIDENLALNDGFLYNSFGVMEFDVADLDQITGPTLFDVILHEIAHVIGFGDPQIWNFFGVYVQGSHQYTGSNAVAEYQNEFGATTNYVPVESDGGPGTADAHWDEAWAGSGNELMTGYLSVPATLSNTTLRSFADIGFIVASNPAVVPLPAPLLLFGSAIVTLISLQRRKIRLISRSRTD